MQLDNSRREIYFRRCRAVSPELGNAFQNPMDLTPEVIDAEIHALDQHASKVALLKSHLLILRKETFR